MLRAVQVVVEEGLAQPILVGRPAVIDARLERFGLSVRPGKDFELAILPDTRDHLEVARWADVFCHPLAPAPAGLAAPPRLSGRPTEMVSALRRVGGRARLRTYDLETFKIEERWLD